MAQLSDTFLKEREKIQQEVDYLKKFRDLVKSTSGSAWIGHAWDSGERYLAGSFAQLRRELPETLKNKNYRELTDMAGAFQQSSGTGLKEAEKKLESFKKSERQQVSQQRRQTIFAGARAGERNLDPTPQQNKITTPVTQQKRRRPVFSTNETPFASMQRENIFKKVLGA